MLKLPSRLELERALVAASVAHHDYEQNRLGGVRDDQWPGWYAAYVLGRLGDFASPSELAAWLEGVETEHGWPAAAAARVGEALGVS